jgi:hypothetical protein
LSGLLVHRRLRPHLQQLDRGRHDVSTDPNVPADRARAMLGHSDRGGQNTSWITSHLSQGCSKQALINTGGAGHLYCFASN